MKFIDAFPVRKGDIVALVGAGGKTTTMYAIGSEARKCGWKVVLTTTTRIFHPGEREGLELVIEADPVRLLVAIKEKLAQFPLLVAGAGLSRENKLVGIEQDVVAMLLQCGADLVVVEADGAAQKPFKAPRESEPVIPDSASLVVPVVGIDCLGRPLNEKYTHRPEHITRLTGLSAGAPVTGETVSAVLLHKHGYRRDIPAGSRWIPFINKVESEVELARAREIAGLLGSGGAERVIVGAARALDPVREVLEF